MYRLSAGLYLGLYAFRPLVVASGHHHGEPRRRT